MQLLDVESKDRLQAKFANLPVEKKYAVEVFHDQNRNQKMDFKLFPPKPKECAGVSNNAVRRGPPDYQKAKFVLGQETRAIQIDLHY